MSRSLYLVLCACAGAQAEPAPLKTPPAKPSMPSAQRIRVTMPAEGPDLSTAIGSTATREPQPHIAIEGWTASTDRPTTTFQKPALALGESRGELIYAVEYPDGKLVTQVHTFRGEQYEIPLGTRQSTRWYDLAPGVLAVTHTPTKALVSRFDHGNATATWRTELSGAAIDDAAVVGWFEDNAPIVSVHSAHSTELSVLDIGTGNSRNIATTAPGMVVPSVGHKTFALISDALLPDCQPCSRVEVRALGDGKELSHVVIPESPIAFHPPAGGTQTVGFDGKQLWRYAYVPAHHSDVMGRGFAKDCSYDVFDLASGKKLHSLDAAENAWRELSTDCRVRSLLPLADGGVLAVAVTGVRTVDVMRFRSAP